MASPSSSRKPINWDDYERGRSSRHNSVAGSVGSHVQFQESPERGNNSQANNGNAEWHGTLRERGSSMSMRIAHAGGVNSIENFARSWQRAACFPEIPSRDPSFIILEQEEADGGEGAEEEEDITGPPRADEENNTGEDRSLFRHQRDRVERHSASAVVEDEVFPVQDEDNGEEDVIAHAPYLSSPFASRDYGIYGSLSSRVNESSIRHAGRLFQQQQVGGTQEPDKEHEPLLIKRVEREDGKVVQVVVGQSTLPQTIFNSVNVLVGVGLLSIPLGFRYSGWLIAMIFFLFSAAVTRYTASILAKCLDVNQSMVTFADIAYMAFGTKARIATSIIFFFELIAASVALVVLFADSLDALIPGWGGVEWKILCGVILIPLSFVPLRYLSITSVLGIFCCFGIVSLVFVDGLIKPHTPGSLREPAKTHIFPARWSTLPLSFGLLMSPWGGHSVFPNIYRDMRHPRKYSKALDITYSFTYLLELSMAVAGLLMFGEKVRDEVTSNIFKTDGYPQSLSVLIVIFIAIIPLTKIPLNARPIVVTVELLLGLTPQSLPPSSTLTGLAGSTRGLFKLLIRISTILVIILVAILFPSFDKIMALSGSALTFTICIILPLAFYLRIFGEGIGTWERGFCWGLIVGSTALSVTGTVWVFLPAEMTGAV